MADVQSTRLWHTWTEEDGVYYRPSAGIEIVITGMQIADPSVWFIHTFSVASVTPAVGSRAAFEQRIADAWKAIRITRPVIGYEVSERNPVELAYRPVKNEAALDKFKQETLFFHDLPQDKLTAEGIADERVKLSCVALASGIIAADTAC